MITKYSKYLLWFSIASSISILAFKITAIYQAGDLLFELPFTLLSLLIICSPYIFMLRRGTKLPTKKSLQINYAIFTLLISASGVGLLFTLIYITPDAQNGVLILFLVFLQWLAIGVAALIASVLNKVHHATNT